MNKELIKRYIEYLNDALKYEEDPNEADTLEYKRDDLLDILKGNNKCKAIEDLAITCPDEEVIGNYECLGACDAYNTFCCEECWKRILNI